MQKMRDGSYFPSMSILLLPMERVGGGVDLNHLDAPRRVDKCHSLSVFSEVCSQRCRTRSMISWPARFRNVRDHWLQRC